MPCRQASPPLDHEERRPDASARFYHHRYRSIDFYALFRGAMSGPWRRGRMERFVPRRRNARWEGAPWLGSVKAGS